MQIPENAFIAKEKLTRYLLVPRQIDDKFGFLAQAGFTRENPSELEAAMRRQISQEEAVSDRVDQYGTYYQVHGHLQGPNGVELAVITVWLCDAQSKQYRFITLKPWR
ncbi:MAG: hypothetical protein R6X32_05245 [Chloroflexota bacterium]